jgi:hypothetical protein
MDTLIADLEAATEGSRELDARIENRLNGGSARDLEYVLSDIERTSRPPAFTSSLDAAMTLVPEGWYMRKLAEFPDGWACKLLCGAKNVSGATVTNTPALALVIACMRARTA